MRELVKRTISGVVFVLLIVGSILLLQRTSVLRAPYNLILYALFFSFCLAGCIVEYLKLRGIEERKIHISMAVVGIFYFILTQPFIWHWLIGGSTIERLPFLLIALISLILILLLIIFVSLRKIAHNKTQYLLLSLIYIVAPFCLMNLLSYNYKLLLSIFLIMWASDIGAYCVGTAFGQGKNGHKLAPKISPKKSWEGVFGGAVFAVAVALVLRRYGLLYFLDIENNEILSILIFALLVFTLCVLGDLLESKIKRTAGVKDSGSIMPGHGGFLDRFDSMLLVMPGAMIFLIIYAFVLHLIN